MQIHAFIISWEGHGEKAAKIAASLAGAVPALTVIYSNHANADENGPGEWVKVPDEYYYGRKFSECLKRFRGDVMLQIQADADCDDWLSVIRSIEHCYSKMPKLEVWSPDIDYSYWTTDKVSLGETRLPGVHLVVQTDGVAWGLTRRSIERLRQLDFEQNNLGWGIELAAICFALSNALFAARDTNVKIRHPRGTGYDVRLARTQQKRFFEGLTLQERLQRKLIMKYTDTVI